MELVVDEVVTLRQVATCGSATIELDDVARLDRCPNDLVKISPGICPVRSVIEPGCAFRNVPSRNGNYLRALGYCWQS